MLPEDDRLIETCRSVLRVLMEILIIKDYICASVGVLLKQGRVKFTLEQTTKAQGGSRGITPLFL